MEFGVDKIHVPNKHSFITRELRQDENATPRIHSHKNFELNFVVSGTGRRIVGNHISSFQQEDLVLLGPDLPHCWEFLGTHPEKPATCIVVHFYENIISSDFFNIPELEEVEKLLRQANRGILFNGKQLSPIRRRLEKLVKIDGLGSYIELLHVFNLLLQVEDREFLSQSGGCPPVFAKDLNQINQIYEYVFKNIREGVSLQEAAEILHMAPASFCRYFKKMTHTTFMKYVKSVRIEIAARMLSETDKQITRICYESGYKNLANFNHQFKTLMKKTPSEYRKDFR